MIWLGWVLKAPEVFFNARQWAPVFETVGATGKFECVTRFLRQHTAPQDTLTARGIISTGKVWGM